MSSRPAAVEALPQPALSIGASARPTSLRRPAAWPLALRMWSRAGWVAWRASAHPVRAMRVLASLRAAARIRDWDTPAGAHAQRSRLPKFVTVRGRHFYALHTPGWPSRAFDDFVRREIDRAALSGPSATTQMAIVAITARCALKCEHCFEWDALNQPEPLSSADLHEVVRRLHARGLGQIFFSGGEPLQRFDDLLSITTMIAADTDAWILTSGVGLTRDRANRLAAAGLTGVAISLDHWDDAAHDRFRGLPGAGAAVTRAAAHAREAGLVVALSLCPTRAFVTASNLERYAMRARDLGASFIQILEPKAVGHYAGQDVALTGEQRRQLEAFCARLNTDPAARHLPSVTYPDWSTRVLGCVGGGDRYLYIDTRGDLHACPFCRTPGRRALDGDLDVSISRLQAAGCPAAGSCAREPAACSPTD